MENYICINGNKTELTEEQLKQLGFEVKKKSPFEKVEYGEMFYYIHSAGRVEENVEANWESDKLRYNIANYCTDKALMEQRALHETLNRLLWRYSMEHDGDKIDWENKYSLKFTCWYDHSNGKYEVGSHKYSHWLGTVSFYTIEIAQNAIKEVIEPFMKEHPEFKW
jgi:hypothetical protein